MTQALNALQTCIGSTVIITCGRGRHDPTNPHMNGLAVDLGHNINQFLGRDQVVVCFYLSFPLTSYGQQEYDSGNPADGYHFHLQYPSGRGGAHGFARGIQPNNP
jgi:hypothetical protein